MDQTQTLQLPDIPDSLQHATAEIARARFGKAAPRGNALVAAIRRTSLRYTRNRADLAGTMNDPATLTARLQYFLPRDLYKVWGPLNELAACGVLPRRPTLRMLDVGAGVGASSLGVASFLDQFPQVKRLTVLALDAEPTALELYGALVARLQTFPGPTLEARTRCTPVTADGDLPEGPFDLVVIGLLLNELLQDMPVAQRTDYGSQLLVRLVQRLSEDGCLIVLEPALRGPSRDLHRIRDRLQAALGPPYVFAPCLGVPSCPMLVRERDWCHERLPGALPEAVAALSRAAGLRAEAPTFSYLCLRRQPGTLALLAHPPLRAYRVVGGPVRSKGKVMLSLCGTHDAPQLMRLDRHRPPGPDPLAELGRGAILALPTSPSDATRGSRPSFIRVGPDSPLQVLQLRLKPNRQPAP